MKTFEGSVPLLIGPILAKDQRGVTPVAVIKLGVLFGQFLDAGLTNAMVLPKRLEAGIRQAFVDSPDKACKTLCIGLYAFDLTEHIRFCFPLLRLIRLERDKPNASGISKIGALERKAKDAELIVVDGLVRRTSAL